MHPILLLIPIALSQIDPVGTEWEALKKTRLTHFDLQAPFVDDQLQNPNWEFGRDAYTEVNKFMRLTNDAQSQDGWLWARKNIGVSSWTIEFTFNIFHDGALSGDGFAFWAAKDTKISGPVFGNQDYFTGVGVLFDTYANSRVRHSYPWIMAMNGDGKTHYDHDFDGSTVEMGGCHQEIRNKPFPTSVRITYLDGDYLKVDLRAHDAVTWTNCFRVGASILPSYSFGFTAMTGGVTSKHDIFSLIAYEVDHKSSNKGSQQVNNFDTKSQFNNFQSQTPPPKSDGSWGFFTYLVVFVILGFIGYVVYVYVKTKEKQSYKRF